MDIVVLARMCLRRWYVFLVVVVLAVGYAVVNYESAKPTYTATAQLIVVAAPRSAAAADTAGRTSAASAASGNPTTSAPPTATGSPTGSGDPTPQSARPTPTPSAPNPLQNVQTTIVALVARMQSRPTTVRAEGGSATYSVVQAKRGGPLVAVIATGTGAAAVKQALANGIPATSSALRTLQDDVDAPADSRFRAVTLTSDSATTQQYPSRTKGLVVTLAVGFLVAVLLAAITDAILARGRRRSTARRDESAPPV